MSEGRPIDEADRDVEAGHALFELAPRLTRLENAVLRGVTPPLTFRQYRLLQRVAQGHRTVTALGRLATISLPAVSESVDVLVRKRLLERRADERDRRASVLEVTDAGRRALASGDALLAETARRILAEVPDGRRARLATDIRLVIDRVTRELVGDPVEDGV